MSEIAKIFAREILDSRGNPTIEVDVILESGVSGRASVPSGASVGTNEAVELRDNDKKRYLGKGVKKAVSNINGEIFDCLKNISACDQMKIDHMMIDLDGTENKARLGANAILAVSMASAKAAANYYDMPLFRYLGGVSARIMPMPLMNIINGGAHANNMLDIQEFMIMPVASADIRENVRIGAEIFHHLKAELQKKGLSTSVGDEGGFAPAINSSEQALEEIINAAGKAGYKIGRDVMLALDVAASEFYQDGIYHLKGIDKKLNSDELVEYFTNLVNNYQICSIEDPMSEHDHEGWKKITTAIGDKIQIVGDDLFVTNPKLLKHGIENKMANSILIKPNQIGTITETMKAVDIAQRSGYKAILSHRSGETEDTAISHIAVATNCGQIKTGSASRTDRICKYNELFRIAEIV
jgi:enolase